MNEAATMAAGRRRRLPDRRFSETRRLHWAGQTIFVTVGYGPDGVEPREIFYSAGYRSGSDMEALVSDLCIALSVMLQHDGITAATLGRSMGEAFDLRTGDPMPASILGLLLEELSRPPGWADALARAGATGISEPEPGEADRPDNHAPARATRHRSGDRVRSGAESGEADG